MKGSILEYYPGKGKTVKCSTHSAILKDKLKKAISNKRRELLSKIVRLHHENARLNVTTAKFEISSARFCHSLPTFREVGQLTEASRGRGFGSDEDVEEVMC